jgi:uncharacterized protein YjbI with pentapeptide repeats
MPPAPHDTESPVGSQIYDRLAASGPEERTKLILQLIQSHPRGRLDLPAPDGQHAILSEIRLGRADLENQLEAGNDSPRWWSAEIQGVNLNGADLRGARLGSAVLDHADLRGADLRGAVLRGSDLREAAMEGVNLSGADLAGANLAGAALGEADFQGAMLEDANFQGAHLRFANFSRAVLETANLGRADLWGAIFERAVLTRADFRGATLKEANLQGADLTQASLYGANLSQADLRRACLREVDLQGVDLARANLEGTVLTGTRLQGVDLTECNIAGVHLSGARLEKTRLRQDQLGKSIGEERAGQFEEARLGYLSLERNFSELGDPDAAMWAYGRKRRMEKLQARERAAAARAAGEWRTAASWYAKYASDQAVEWLCDYGSSISRVLLTLLGVFVLFTLIYGMCDGVVRVDITPTGPVLTPTRNPVDWVVFSMSAMSPTAKHPAGMLPRNDWIQLLATIQNFLGIALAGLIGFVFGNTARR